MTQEQLAVQCQVHGMDLTRSTLAKIEARLRLIKACELYIIAKLLKTPMESFYPANFGAVRRDPSEEAKSTRARVRKDTSQA